MALQDGGRSELEKRRGNNKQRERESAKKREGYRGCGVRGARGEVRGMVC